MNNVQLIGNLTKDIELRKTQSGKSVVNFILAVARTFNREETDFIQCQAWSKTADILHQYCHKGSKIGLSGSIETGSYDKNGQRVYTTTVIANNIELLTPREPMTSQNALGATNTYRSEESSFMKPKYDYASSMNGMEDLEAQEAETLSDELPF